MIIFSDEVFSVLKLVVFLNILCRTDFIYYYYFFSHCFSQQKGKFRRRKWQLTPVFLPEESQGWGSLVGCRLWGRTESATTEAT